MSDLSMLINGLRVTAERNATFERRNPLDGTVATRAPAASPGDAVMAVEAAAEAFRSWSETGPGQRRALLLKAADALERIIDVVGDDVPDVHRQPDRVAREQVRQVACFRMLRLSLVEVVVALAGAMREVIHGPREDAEEVVIPGAQRSVRRRVAQVPRADQRGGITGFTQ